MRATTLIPRSWPSSPTLATSTRAPVDVTAIHNLLETRGFDPGAEHALEGGNHLAHRGPDPRRLHQRRHDVGAGIGGVGDELTQGALDRSAITGVLHGVETLALQLLGLHPDREDLRLVVV